LQGHARLPRRDHRDDQPDGARRRRRPQTDLLAGGAARLMARQILTNANVVLPHETIEGSVVIEGDRIAEISSTRRYADGLDLGGRFLIPGVIDIHTDYMEKELAPRPGASFPLNMAFHFMDVRAIACGLTTVLGAARISNEEETQSRISIWRGDGL